MSGGVGLVSGRETFFALGELAGPDPERRWETAGRWEPERQAEASISSSLTFVSPSSTRVIMSRLMSTPSKESRGKIVLRPVCPTVIGKWF